LSKASVEVVGYVIVELCVSYFAAIPNEAGREHTTITTYTHLPIHHTHSLNTIGSYHDTLSVVCRPKKEKS